jgi:uncharacterized protein (TIGR03663 family)
MKRPTKSDVIALTLLAIGIAMRFQDLSLRPFHHDEGVNGFFLTRLFREGVFKYDPGNYHGPTLYYLTLPLVAILGLSDAAVRGTVAIFGVLTLVMLWRFLSRFGSFFALSAIALFTTSPGAVFYSRYFIHEALFVAFTLGALVAAPYTGNQQRWRYAATGLALGLLFATKETAFVSFGAVAGGAVVAAWLVEGISPIALLRGIGPYCRAHAEDLMHGLLAFAISAGLFYSSFFRNPSGVIDAFRTFAFWTKTAVRDHENPWDQHFRWLAEADPVLLTFGLTGVLVALILRRSFVGVLAAVWTLLIFFAYSVVKYKTPWLGLNMLLPLAIMSGYLLKELASITFIDGGLSLKAPAVTIGSLATLFSITKSHELERQRYDDETHPYLYAHTQRTFLDLVRVIEERGRALGTGKETAIAVIAPENWPLAWYLRDYTKTGYWGEFKADVEGDIFVASVAQEAPLSLKLGDSYERFGPYNMRGVVDLLVFSRKPPPKP